jgi:hypothetical protein
MKAPLCALLALPSVVLRLANAEVMGSVGQALVDTIVAARSSKVACDVRCSTEGDRKGLRREKVVL